MTATRRSSKRTDWLGRRVSAASGLTCVVAVLTLVSCLGQDEAVPHERGAAWGDSLVLVEELRIGGLTGDDAYTFGSVSALWPSSDGTLYVADGQVPVIRRYDGQGVHIADIGRGGEGPGEFGAIDGLVVAPNGNLEVWDSRNRRLTVFDSAANVVRTHLIPEGMGGWRGFVAGVNGTVLIRVRPTDGFFETAEGVRSDWARINENGEPERVATSPLAEREGPRYVLAGRGGYYRPFVTETLSAMGVDGTFYWARNDEYVIHRVLPTGEETVITRDEPRIRLGPEEMAEWEAWSTMFAERSPQNRDRYFPVPEIKPFMRELVTDADARVWVSRYTEAVFREYTTQERIERENRDALDYRWRDLPSWDVFSPEGEYLGVVTLPFRTSFYTAIGERVWGIQAGDYDEDYVVRWRIEAVEAG